jgi:hypothetical protein
VLQRKRVINKPGAITALTIEEMSQ